MALSQLPPITLGANSGALRNRRDQPYILGMSEITSSHNDPRIVAALAIGLDLDTARLIFAVGKETIPTPPRPSVALSDQEWELIEPLLPGSDRQHSAMPQRVFVNLVLCTAGERRGWTTAATTGQGEAVRKRFARWATLGVWQNISGSLAALDLTSYRRQQFAELAQRAERLCR